MTYEQFLQAKAPPWLADPFGAAWMGGIGATFDDYVADFINGTMLAFPGQSVDDALAALGDEIGIWRGSSEATLSFATRLLAAWMSWKLAGTPVGLLAALYWGGFDGATLFTQNGLVYSLSGALSPGVDPTTSLVIDTASALPTDLGPVPAGTPWVLFDNNWSFCSRFSIVFQTPLTSPNVVLLKAIIQKWKPAKTTFVGAYEYSGTAGTWGWPIRTWGNGELWGDSSVTRIIEGGF